MEEMLRGSYGGQDPDAEWKTKGSLLPKNAKRDSSQNEGSNKVTTESSKKVATGKWTKKPHEGKNIKKSTTENSHEAVKKRSTYI